MQNFNLHINLGNTASECAWSYNDAQPFTRKEPTRGRLKIL